MPIYLLQPYNFPALTGIPEMGSEIQCRSEIKASKESSLAHSPRSERASTFRLRSSILPAQGLEVSALRAVVAQSLSQVAHRRRRDRPHKRETLDNSTEQGEKINSTTTPMGWRADVARRDRGKRREGRESGDQGTASPGVPPDSPPDRNSATLPAVCA